MFSKSLEVAGWNWPSETVTVPDTFIEPDVSTSVASSGVAELFIKISLKSLVDPVPPVVIVWAPDPLKVTVPLRSSKVPLLDQSPPTDSALLTETFTSKVELAPIDKSLATTMASCRVKAVLLVLVDKL